jgi:disulfide bond formation protein DsbB
MKFTFRAMFLAVLASCIVLLGFGLYLQHIVHLEPCPLCIMQRVAFIFVGLTALLAFLFNPRGAWRRIFGLLIALFALAGAGIAGRNIGLQHLPPDQVPECGPGLEYLLDAFPLAKALPMLLQGSGECAKVEWTMLGMSIPMWAMGWFLLFIVAGLAALFLKDR